MGWTIGPKATIRPPTTPEESLSFFLFLSKVPGLDPMATAKIRIGAWTANPALNLVEQGRRSVRLEPRAMDVLMHLATRNGAMSSVEDLMSTVWRGVVVSDGSVYLAISHLRQALGDADGGASYIETVPKRGYRLTVPVQMLADAPAAESAPHLPRQRRGVRLAAVATVAVLVAAMIAAWLAISWRTPLPTADHSLAVLPFADLSPDGDQAYFADGVTEEVLNRLARVRDLRVIGRTSSFQLRGQGADARALGEKLGVEHLLVGSVRKAADRVRVTAQLSEARTGEQLWSQTYERKLNDIFAIQDEIAKAVAEAMQVKLGVGELARMPGMTRDVAAYDEYLRGMALNLVMRRESFPPAIAHLQRAVDIDPKFSMALSGLHSVFSNGAFAVPERAEEWRRAAAESLERARQLTPDAPHVLLELGVASVRSGDYLQGAGLFERLEKSYAEHGMAAEAAGPRGILLLAVGRVRESIRSLEDARAHDPLAPAYAGFLSQAYLAHGDFRSALAEIDRGLQLEGLREGLLNSGLTVALNSGDRGEIERRLAAIPDDNFTARVHRRLAQFLGKPAGVATEIRSLLPTASDNEKVALAVWAAYYAQHALALEILTDVVPRRGHVGVIWIPLFTNARSQPEFVELVARLGMADYWRTRGFADFCKPAGQQIQCR
jgi:TolB-like protein/DNA-binding winged helix-turn-helix (wHTH) protein